MDQPLLNVVFADRINWLDRRYNASDLYDLGVPADVRVMHFTGPNKPWHDDYSRIAPQYHYWLKFGCGHTGFPLLASRLRIALWTPKRLLGQTLRKRREAGSNT
jgi:lipopolysaccharide biosynthesis glycosyltransferase